MLSSKKILIVDDEPDAIEYVREILTEHGIFDFFSAEDGPQAIKIANSKSPDLIILDVMMPEKDGFKVFHELRQNSATRHIPVIMLTGVADKVGIRFFKKDMKEYLGSEPVDYIEKPVQPQKLVEAVNKALA